jgi:hypothetical protein
MSEKQQILKLLSEEFDRWEAQLAGLSEAQITAPVLPPYLSIKDVIAHLMAWQQVSIARLEAAQANTAPVYPGWLGGLDPESEAEIDQFNARIYETYRSQSWVRVHQDWRAGFLRLLKLGEDITEKDLMDIEKYPWLKGFALFDVLQGSYEHHHIDHLEPLLTWLSQHGDARSL